MCSGLKRSSLMALLLWVLTSCTSPTLTRNQDVQTPQGGSLVAGPMVGYSAPREVVVWLQTQPDSQVWIRYWPDERRDSSAKSVSVRADEDGVAKVVISDLEPGQRFGYVPVINGVERPRPYALRFQTQMLWRWRSAPPDLSVAFGSCMYVNDPMFDRPGDPYGGGYEIFDAILARQPDAMLWVGDNVYLREGDWSSQQRIVARYAHTRALDALQPLLGSVHHYATWDDHDYGSNDADWSFPLKGVSLATFNRFWANPSAGLPELPGVFTTFSLSDVDFFLLDDRTYRMPKHAPISDDKVMLGDRQLQWLLDALTASTATFKVVVNGGQLLNSMRVYENFARYPAERQRLLDGLAARKIEGVIFISGDRHHGELIRLERPDLYPLYEFTSSPLTAGASDAKKERDNPMRVPGTLIVEQRNFGMLSFQGEGEARAVTLAAYGTSGKELWSHTIEARALKVPKPK